MPNPLQRHRRCRIVFRGESNVLALAFPDMAAEFDGGKTALVGPILDQPQLQGIIARAESLGFELVSLNPIEADLHADG